MDKKKNRITKPAKPGVDGANGKIQEELGEMLQGHKRQAKYIPGENGQPDRLVVVIGDPTDDGGYDEIVITNPGRIFKFTQGKTE